jgi:hypothetical protein
MLASVLGVFLFSVFSMFDVYTGSFIAVLPYTDVISLLRLLFGLSLFKKVLVIFAAAPFVSSFCGDWNTQYIRFLVARCGVFRYVASKVVVCFLSSLAVVFLGLLLFVLGLLPFTPLTPDDLTPLAGPPFGMFLTDGLPVLYLLVLCFLFALGNSFWAVCGLTVSAYIPNRFVAILSPFLLSYILEEITSPLPPWINLYRLTRVYDVIGQGPLLTFLYYLLIFGVLIFLCTLLFSRQVKKRVHNDVV